MEFWIPAIILILIIVCVIAVKAKREDDDRKAYQQQKIAEENKRKKELERFQSNENIKKWASEIAQTIQGVILSNPHWEHTFQIRAYTNAFDFGYHLESVWLDSLHESINQTNRKVIMQGNFSRMNLPDLKYEDCEWFVAAIGDLVVSELATQNIIVTAHNRSHIVNTKGYADNDVKEKNICEITYKVPKVEGTW